MSIFHREGGSGGEVEYRRLLGDLAETFLSVFRIGYMTLIYAPEYGDIILY